MNGDKVTLEDNGTDKIYYSYDASGNLVSMNLNGTEYYYIRNAQGDIIGLFDSAGTQVVSYTYDSWGKLISTSGTLASTVGVKNPYLYRGYRSDTETGLYYLQSRYYSPEWGRFINADGIVGTPGKLLSANMFVYGLNNPVNMSDPNGKNPFALLIGAVAATVAFEVVAVVAVVAVAVVLTAVLIDEISDRIYSDSSPNAEVSEKPSEDIFGIPSSETPSASKVREKAQSKGWKKVKPPGKAEKWLDENGTPRITLKRGSPRTPGSEGPHIELRNRTGQRIDRFGNPVSKRSSENHTPLNWDVRD